MSELQKLIELEQDARLFGFEWPNQEMILKQVMSECQEILDDINTAAPKHKIQEEIGDLLHAAISLCVFSGFDVEETLAKNNVKFTNRMTMLKKLTHAKALKNLQGQKIDFMMALWKEVKSRLMGDAQ